MEAIKEFFILGLPVETDFGKIHFIKLRDYQTHFMDLELMSWNKAKIIYKYIEINKNGELDGLIETMKELDLYDIVAGTPELRESYHNVFLKVFDDKSAIDLIDRDSFEYYRKLILDMNCIKEENVNPNPEIQKHLERSKRVKQREREKVTLADICSSVVAHSGVSYNELLDWTIYQLYMTFFRIGQFKRHDATTLFSIVPTEKKIDVESWSKHINLYEEESHVIDRDVFKKQTNDKLK